MRGNTAYLKVEDKKRGASVCIDLKVAETYILTLPQWFNTLKTPITLHLGQRLEDGSTVPVHAQHDGMVGTRILAQVENLLPRPPQLAQRNNA